ncbi:hypothetical protein ABGN05_05270 [Aquibium sp. LZ166]|uniref:Uncharacterized protein n=1 Tax=Aquibium pacificus TaxID=3153579 RepID=A0ABV3SFI4_9HYPH
MSTQYNSTDYASQFSISARLIILLIGIGVLVSTFAYININSGVQFLEKGKPDWNFPGLLGIISSAIVACCLFFAFRSLPHSAHASPSTDREGRFIAIATTFSGFVLLLSAVTVLLAPQVLNETVREGQFVGFATDFVLLVALAYFGLCIAYSRHASNFRIFGCPPALVFAAMFSVAFLILMEEMSWGQHLLGWEAGELFAGNAQNETNLHNFATYKFEAAYYSAAFAAFVALPFFWPATDNTILRSLSPFVPRRFFALLSLPIAGLLYEEWNILLYQVWFFLGAAIALQLVLEARERGRSFPAGGMLALLVGSQGVFLIFGSGMVDGYELSEIRELLIAFAIACYARLMFGRLKTSQRSQA